MMMFRLKEKRFSVKDFLSDINAFIVDINNTDKVFIQDEEFFISSVPVKSMIGKDDILIIIDLNGESFVFDISKKEEKVSIKGVVTDIIDEQNVLIHSDDRSLQLKNINSGNTKWRSNLKAGIIAWISPFILCTSYNGFKDRNKEVVCLDYQKDQVVWRKKISEWCLEAKINKGSDRGDIRVSGFLGATDQQLFIATTSGDLIIVDSTSGNLIEIIETRIPEYGFSSVNFFIDRKIKKLIHPLAELDIETGTFISRDFEKMGIPEAKAFIPSGNMPFTFNENHIFFSLIKNTWPIKNRPSVGECYLFALDRATEKVNWQFQLNKGKEMKGVKKMELNQEKLHVLDFGDILTIFTSSKYFEKVFIIK